MNKVLRVALVWNGTVLQEKTLRKGGSVELGRSGSNSFVMPVGGDIAGNHTLMSPSGDGYTISLGKDMEARVVSRGQEAVLTSGSTQVAPGDYGVVRSGDAAIYFQFVDDDAVIAGGFAGVDLSVLNSMLLSFFVHGTALMIILSLLPNLRGAGDFTPDDRFAQILAELPPNAIEDIEEEEMPEDDSTSKAAGGEEGRFGEEDAPVEDSVLPDHDGPLVDQITNPELGRAMDAAIGMSGALANVFGATDSFSDQFGSDFATAGQGDVFVLGSGNGGLGMRGGGTGGGGDGLGRIQGVGGIDTGSGRGQGASLGRRGERAPRARVDRGNPNIAGFLSREQIERVVRRHSRGIQYCYERELQNNPELGGRISVNWTIGLDGRVTSASISENSTGNRNVESCVLAEVRRMRFDQPDGGNVAVTYPFTFRSSAN